MPTTLFPFEIESGTGFNPHLPLVWQQTRDFLVARRENKLEPPTHSEVKPAVRYEVQRFEKSFDAKVDDKAGYLLRKEIEEFCFQPDDTWNVVPAMHATYAIALVVSIPIVLRNIWRRSADHNYVHPDQVAAWLKANVVAICPYVCPGTQHG